MAAKLVLLKQVMPVAAEMKYMRRTAGYNWTDYKTNVQIVNELKIIPFLTNNWNTREAGYNM